MTESLRREREALAFALEMLGFDPDHLVTQLQEASPERYWACLGLAASRVSFDHEQANAVEPGLSPVAIAAVQSWWLDARPAHRQLTTPFLPTSDFLNDEYSRLRLAPAQVKRIQSDLARQAHDVDPSPRSKSSREPNL